MRHGTLKTHKARGDLVFISWHLYHQHFVYAHPKNSYQVPEKSYGPENEAMNKCRKETIKNKAA